jgi:hypothetical protein
MVARLKLQNVFSGRGYVPKPYSPRQLLAKIREYLPLEVARRHGRGVAGLEPIGP